MSEQVSQIPEWVQVVVFLMIIGAAALATKKRLAKKKEVLKEE